MDKCKDVNFGFEIDLLKEIDEALRDPTIKLRIKNSISNIEETKEESIKTAKMLEELKRENLELK